MLNERAAISSCISMCWLPHPPTTAIHCVGWLPFSFSLLSAHFPPLALSTSLAIYQVNSRLKRVWRPGIPKGVMPPQLQPQPPTSFCNHSTRARAALKGIKMNWMKIEIENENEKWKMKTHAKKERKSRQHTKNNTHNTKSKRNPLHIKRTRMSRGREGSKGGFKQPTAFIEYEWEHENTYSYSMSGMSIYWCVCTDLLKT